METQVLSAALMDKLNQLAVVRGISPEEIVDELIETDLRNGAYDERIYRFFELSLDMMCIVGFDGCFQRVNPVFETVLGYSAEELRGILLPHLLHKDDLEATRRELAKHRRGIASTNFVNRFRCKDGTYKWLSWTSWPVPGEQALYAVARDNTERMQFIDALQKSNHETSTILESIGDGFFTVDKQWRVMYMNSEAERLLRVSRARLMGKNLWDEFAEAVDSTFYRQYQWALENQMPVSFIEFYPPLRGWYEVHAYPSELGLSVYFRDVTERVEIEQALRESEHFAHAVFNALSARIAIIDHSGTIIATNQAWRSYLHSHAQTETNAAEGANYLDVCDAAQGPDAHYAKAVAAGIRAVISHEQDEFTLEYPCDTPEKKQWMLVRVTHFHATGPDYVVIAHEDITERKLAEQAEYEQRIFAEALHDITTILTSTLDTDEVLRNILTHVARVVPHNSADVILIDDEQAIVVHHMGGDASGAHDVDHFVLRDMPYLQWIVKTRRPFIIPDIRSHEKLLTFHNVDWVRSCLIAPLMARGDVIGFISLNAMLPDAFTSEHIKRLEVFASQASAAIYNAQLYATARDRAHEMERRIVERTDELHQVKEHVEAILNNSSDAIILVNGSGIIKQTNPAFNKLFDYEPDVIFRQPLAQIAAPEQAALMMDAVNRVTENHQPQRIEINARRRDSEVFAADVALAPLVDYKTAETNVILSLRDISEQKRAEEELRKALEKEKELSNMRSQFVSVVSHEFRTPLAIIMSSAGIIKTYGERMTEDKKVMRLTQIEEQVRQLTDLINDVLTISRDEAVGTEINLNPLDLEAFIRDAADEVLLGTGGSHNLRFTHSGMCRRAVLDANIFKRALRNLLSNAFKYSASGSTVYCDLHCVGGQAVIKVRDEGIGIPPEDLSRLFQSFQRGRNVNTIPGTGLGLVIAKQAVEAHRGYIDVESEVGKGTTFTIFIPIDPELALTDDCEAC